jgi:hypothetical protein
MNKEEFDYYVFVDYSENLIGYIIIERGSKDKLLPIIQKLKHYKGLKCKVEYLNATKKSFGKNNLFDYLVKNRITELRQNVEICSEIFDFCKSKETAKIFISVDDRQYRGFMKLASIIDGKRFKIVKEGSLKRNSIEYKMSLIIDTLLNLKRTRDKK